MAGPGLVELQGLKPDLAAEAVGQGPEAFLLHVLDGEGQMGQERTAPG